MVELLQRGRFTRQTVALTWAVLWSTFSAPHQQNVQPMLQQNFAVQGWSNSPQYQQYAQPTPTDPSKYTAVCSVDSCWPHKFFPVSAVCSADNYLTWWVCPRMSSMLSRLLLTQVSIPQCQKHAQPILTDLSKYTRVSEVCSADPYCPCRYTLFQLMLTLGSMQPQVLVHWSFHFCWCCPQFKTKCQCQQYGLTVIRFQSFFYCCCYNGMEWSLEMETYIKRCQLSNTM